MTKIIPPTPCCCGFCGRTHEQVHRLVRGVVGAMPPLICDGCVEAIYLDLGLDNQPTINSTVEPRFPIDPETGHLTICSMALSRKSQDCPVCKDDPRVIAKYRTQKIHKFTSSFPERAGGR